MSQPCAASANLASSVFWSLRKLSHASITRQQPASFLTSTRTSYHNGRLLSRYDPSLRRWFRTFSPTHNSSQSHIVENPNSSSTVGGGTSQVEDVTAQSDSGDMVESNTTIGDHSSSKGKHAKPRRHRKDKADQKKPTSAQPVVKYIKTPDPEKFASAKRLQWQIQKEALKRKFQDGWNPRRKLSPDDMASVRHLHAQDPDKYSTPALSEQFKVSPEAIRRILKSKWRPTEEQMAKRRESWEKRHKKIWNQMSEIGLRPERKSLSPYSDAAVLDK